MADEREFASRAEAARWMCEIAANVASGMIESVTFGWFEGEGLHATYRHYGQMENRIGGGYDGGIHGALSYMEGERNGG